LQSNFDFSLNFSKFEFSVARYRLGINKTNANSANEAAIKMARILIFVTFTASP